MANLESLKSSLKQEIESIREDQIIGMLICILADYHQGELVINQRELATHTGKCLKIKRSTDETKVILQVVDEQATSH